MNKRRRSNWYIYVITFVVTGLLLILVSSILLKSFYDSQDKDATVNVSQNQTAIFTPDSTYDFSVLVTLSADEPYEQKTMVDNTASEISTEDAKALMDAVKANFREAS